MHDSSSRARASDVDVKVLTVDGSVERRVAGGGGERVDMVMAVAPAIMEEESKKVLRDVAVVSSVDVPSVVLMSLVKEEESDVDVR